MKALQFFKIIFRQFPLLILANIVILIVVGLIDAATLLSLAPVVDILINPEMQNLSYVTRQVISVMVSWGITATIGKMLLLFFLFNILRSMLTIFSRYFILRTQYALLRHLHIEAFEDFFHARWYFFASEKQGTLLSAFMRELTVVGEAFGAMARFFAQIVQGIMFLVVPFLVSWKITAICLTCGLLLALPFTLFGKISYRLGQMNTATGNRIGAVIQESLGSAKVILGFGNIRYSISSLADAFDAHSRTTIKFQTLNIAISDLYAPLGILILIVAVTVGQNLAIPVSEIVIILYSFMKIIPILGGITANRNALEGFFPSYEQFMGLRLRARELKQKSGNRPFSGFQKKLVLKNVMFAYPAHEPVLKGVDVVVPKGKMVAFVGGSGAGKSTLIDVIMGFNEPLTGSITIDDVPLHEYDIVSYRRRIGYVPQESILFNMSIRDNLLWAKAGATDTELKKAAAQAYAAEFIDSFPDGYGTLAGDRGVRLSGGQIQRIALARALLRDPEILILDEATSSLDTQSERLIQQAIDAIAGETTVIIIAHRLSTIINADYIYVLDNGRVIEEGSYAQLASGRGAFQKMLDLQSLNGELSSDAGRSAAVDPEQRINS
jgi:ABC-type multidrug transport system fused ATPase/permease subunit